MCIFFVSDLINCRQRKLHSINEDGIDTVAITEGKKEAEWIEGKISLEIQGENFSSFKSPSR
jgi:hypothetical protein